MSARPAPALRSVAALTALELRLLTRRGENILATLVIPVAVLLFFGGTSMVAFDGEPMRTLLPGTIALGMIAAGLVNLGIATAYERQYGVLKRLGGAPLPRWGFFAAKLASIVVLQVVQVVLLVIVASTVFDWSPGQGWFPGIFAVAFALGTVTFVGLGLLLAGTLRAEAVLALANGLFIAFLMVGGIVLPVDRLPSFLQPIASVLPSTALADLLRVALDPTFGLFPAEPSSFVVLATWAIGTTVLAVRRFRWD
jgi:ABC-2 type transport system permease protein